MLAELRAQGLILEAAGDKLRFYPRNVDDATLELLRTHKDQLLQTLEDTAILMTHLYLRDALETLVLYGKGHLTETMWLERGASEEVIEELAEMGLIDHPDVCDCYEWWCYVLNPRGWAAWTAIEPEIAKEYRARRHLGPLTWADVWCHDCLIDKGPMPWTTWAAEARPHLLHAQKEVWMESGKAIRHGNYCPPPQQDTAFAKSVFKLIKRGYVERRRDGRYASLRPMMVKAEVLHD